MIFVLKDIGIKGESFGVLNVGLRNPSLAVMVVFKEGISNLSVGKKVQMQSCRNGGVELLSLQRF